MGERRPRDLKHLDNSRPSAPHALDFVLMDSPLLLAVGDSCPPILQRAVHLVTGGVLRLS